MRKAFLVMMLTLGALGMSSGVLAQDNGIYAGLSLGQGNIDVDDDIAPLSGDEFGFKFIVGMRPLDWLAVELSYVDFGDIEEGNLSAESNGVSAFAIGILPAGPVDIFAKVGLINWETTLGLKGVGDVFRDDGTDPAYGAGLQFRLGSLSIRGEYEFFDIDNADDVNMLSLGLTYTFL